MRCRSTNSGGGVCLAVAKTKTSRLRTSKLESASLLRLRRPLPIINHSNPLLLPPGSARHNPPDMLPLTVDISKAPDLPRSPAILHTLRETLHHFCLRVLPPFLQPRIINLAKLDIPATTIDFTPDPTDRRAKGSANVSDKLGFCPLVCYQFSLIVHCQSMIRSSKFLIPPVEVWN